MLCAVLCLAAGVAVAAEEQETWEPRPPQHMPDGWDWIQLVSGEWLKGELIAMYDETLEFDSDELDLLSLDWEDVRQVRTGRTMQVGFLHQITAIGKLHIEGDKVRVIGTEERQFERSQLITIAAGAPKEINYWKGNIALGFNVRQGNTNLLEYSLSGVFRRRTVRERISLEYMGNYNKTDEVEVANNHRVNIEWNRYRSDRLFVTPVFFEYYADPFQNVAHRETVGVGAGYALVDNPRTSWDVSGGPAYQQNTFSSVEPGSPQSQSTPALAAGTVVDIEVTGWIDFIYEYRFQLVNEVSGRYNHHMVTAFETELTRLLDFDIKLIWDRIQDPRPDAMGITPLQDDFRLIVALGLDF